MFFDIATVHIFMLVIMRHLVNELNQFFFLQFLVFIIYTPNTQILLYAQECYSLQSEKNFTALNCLYHLIGQNIF